MIGKLTGKKMISLDEPTYYIVRESDKKWDTTTIVSGGYKSKENALKDCHEKNLELQNSLKVGYIPDVVFGGKFKVIKITCILMKSRRNLNRKQLSLRVRRKPS